MEGLVRECASFDIAEQKFCDDAYYKKVLSFWKHMGFSVQREYTEVGSFSDGTPATYYKADILLPYRRRLRAADAFVRT